MALIVIKSDNWRLFLVGRLYKYNAHPCLAICSQKRYSYRENTENNQTIMSSRRSYMADTFFSRKEY